ncbi:alpha/beta hydrolase [Anaerocolumna cellulosilytica]|uniref:Alpha/beta hydrolase n=1 Tax=Anaerocolumna cellulosilytica TaxID=433286 RepID=A0A6S6R8R7_9FIRM|nr:alpha/beta hydrolase [Anaerocolumna cellulosilytica]MBB5198106.1 pimeloyl-ACP methyl ester carboxylesterase [Anaerocolumna cellulosilytica]BCJ96507.1 alpha/beta hydrolase [Anaerocolumna cellulosilytica]
MEKESNGFLRFIRNTLLTIGGLVFIWMGINYAFKMYERNTYKPPGTLVEVDDRKMHVYQKGQGPHTIILISGLGTAAPVFDFEPLIERLSKHNKVVVVEGFGYGFSETTDKERSVENITREMRSALQGAGIKGPYILMPHSVGGIYATYYANIFPEEVEAIIGIDCTLPRMCDYFGESAPNMSGMMKYFAPSGLARLLLLLDEGSYLPINDGRIYTEVNLRQTRAIFAWKAFNKNIVAETNEMGRNLEKTLDMEFDKKLPVLMFVKENKKVREDGKTSRSFYESYLDDLENGKYVALEGHHYLHWTNSERIGEEVESFIAEWSNN